MPLERALAACLLHWTGTRPGFGHYESVCIQAAIARTDERGRFEIRKPPPLRWTFLVWRRDPAIAVWKPGFDTQAGEGNRWTLTPTQLDAERRAGIATILGHYGCTDEKGMLLPLTDSNGALAAFRSALASEPRR